jgi:hypothetical protein
MMTEPEVRAHLDEISAGDAVPLAKNAYCNALRRVLEE